MNLGGTELLGADIPGYQPMRSAYLSLSVEQQEEAERIYGLLSDGGQIFMPMDGELLRVPLCDAPRRVGTSWMLLHPRAQSASAA